MGVDITINPILQSTRIYINDILIGFVQNLWIDRDMDNDHSYGSITLGVWTEDRASKIKDLISGESLDLESGVDLSTPFSLKVTMFEPAIEVIQFNNCRFIHCEFVVSAEDDTTKIYPQLKINFRCKNS